MRIASMRFPYNIKEYLDPRSYFYVLRHWYERARYGVSRSDQWNLDNYLAAILVRSLPEYRSDGRSYTVFTTKEDHFHSWEPNFDRAAAQARGDAILDEIIAGLSLQLDESIYPGVSEQQRIDRAWQLVAENVQAFWW